MAHGLELRAPMLDHIFFETVLDLPEDVRFTRPPKLMLAPALELISDLDLFNRKKRGFNPPLQPWLHRALSPRFNGLEERLAVITSDLLSRPAVASLIDRYRSGEESLAEGVLQLLILDESLMQLNEMSNYPGC
jgi:asparagine synthase (glutamine-hydrolysing)